ncbi:MAG TPA: putative sugar O-methyltransferase [Planctomycetota bacterium]|nr:putative sugar O-methyltransferase [Planctomycetota bacterium]
MSASEALAEKIRRLGESGEFRTYERVREKVLALKDLEAYSPPSGTGAPSDYWREELENFEYLLDASPLVVSRLRHHSYHVTGLRTHDYRSNRDEARRQLAEKLAALVELGGRDLLVPEPRILGGFGFEIDGGLYNVDTLKFYEALVALEKGAVLGGLRGGGERRVVWEIGAGWGGFAYQLKTLCPNVTYIISDFPELFLFSAVYLMTAFPYATFAFPGVEPAWSAPGRWPEADFIFIANTQAGAVAPPRLDLAVNMVSFQEMTGEQVRDYVTRVHDLKCPFLYSLNRDRSPYNTQLSSVSAIIDTRFWIHEVEVLPVNYTKMMDKVPAAIQKKAKAAARETEGKPEKPQAAGARADLDYRHLIGWRRVKV